MKKPGCATPTNKQQKDAELDDEPNDDVAE